MYDVYYTTGGVKEVGGGSDVWIHFWLKYIAPYLNVKPILMVDRPDPGTANTVDVGDVEVVYRDNEYQWKKLIDGCHRFNILHMYYHERDSVKWAFNKLHSIALHVCTEQSVAAAREIKLPTNQFHHLADVSWENKVIPHATYPIWIGTDITTPFHRDHGHRIINIPNFYPFSYNSDLVTSNTVGFAARIESRKCPHYIAGVESELFTNYQLLRQWADSFGHDFTNSRVYDFNWKFVDNFYAKKSWGIFHGCYRAEPFGYAIMQAVDHGKIPIVESTWAEHIDYPYRAHNAESFREQVDAIRSLPMTARADVLKYIRDTFTTQYGNAAKWREAYLEIYNA